MFHVGQIQFQGGEPEPHAKAQEHAWKTTLDFFRRHLGSSSKTAKL